MLNSNESLARSKDSGNGRSSAGLNKPSISLPKGGGAIKGIGEKFAANPVTGTASLSIPIATSPGRSGFDPELSLSYDSSAGNGPFGFGWSLSLPAITRKTEKGLPQYQDADESDVFQISGAEDLVPILVKGTTNRYEDSESVPGYTIHHYRPRIEGLFARIERWTNDKTGRIYWRTISKDNITSLYGKTENSCIADPDNLESRIFSWLISASYDDKGNAIVYEYAEENDHGIDPGKANEQNRQYTASRFIKRIRYGNRTPNRDVTTWEAKNPHEFLPEDWMFETVFDYDEGHYQDTDPAPDDQHQIAYASAAEKSSWITRPDPFSSYRSGFEIRNNRRCQRVLMFHRFSELGDEPCLVRSTEFNYNDISYLKDTTVEEELAHHGSTHFASFIVSATQSGFVKEDNQEIQRPGYISYRKKTMPPLEFKYSKASIQDDICKIDAEHLENLPIGLDGSIYKWVDLDGEGISGILTEQANAWHYKRNLSPLHQGRKCQEDGKPSQKVEFAALETITTKPNVSLANTASQLMDLAGDGQLDVVNYSGSTPGFYERTHNSNWKTFQPFTKQLNITWDEPNLRFVDLNGDGHADILITEQDVFTWYASEAEKGFSAAKHVSQPHDEERGPKLVFADGTQSIFLADMSGDGLTDLLRIRNGEICYWPNLGYARFGAKVSMDNAPWFDYQDQFDYQRLRLADIDGSGTNDIIYLGQGKVSLYFNQSGNQWTDARVLDQFSHIDNLSSITTTDLLGNGTACLVWSSPLPGDAQQPMRYIDLMGGQKPHLLIKSINNLGAETHIHYAPSTKFYLQDEQNGTPWITKIPFPVHVVERVETIDQISKNRFTSRYAYHHGYFDGVEREFRGFGMVEQWDSDEYAVFDAKGELSTSNEDAVSHIPPIHTKTWFHTGAYGLGDKISLQYVHEYFGAPKPKDSETIKQHEQKMLVFEKAFLPDTILPNNLSAEEEREACRSLKGAMLRQEVYADDNSNKADIPYTITEQNFTIECLQHKGEGNKHAVFFTHEREAISYHYERNTDDPRITHAMTLNVDEYGNVRKSLAIAFGRNKDCIPDEWNEKDKKKQTQTLITYSENDFTDDVLTDPSQNRNNYRIPLPSESRSYEITGLKLKDKAVRFGFDEFVDTASKDKDKKFLVLNNLEEIQYEEQPDPTKKQKRLIEYARILYRKNDLSGLQAKGKLESMALPGESYQLAFTQGLLETVYQRQRNKESPQEDLLSTGDINKTKLNRTMHNEGGYINFNKDDNDPNKVGNWWIPSGQVFFHPEKAATAQQELKEAQKNFFLPRRFQDPFGNNAWVDYDQPYKLFAIRTEDAVKNETQAKYDYRVLQPRLMTDPNDNQTEVAFDMRGMVVGNAIMGKATPQPKEGDSLEGFQADLTQDQINQLLDDPKGQIAHKLLGDASSRIIYDVNHYQKKNDPTSAITLARETHDSDLKKDPATGKNIEKTKIQVSLSYSDGFGREIQKKVQAEQGQVPQRDNDGHLVLDGCYPKMIDGKNQLRWVGSGWTIFNNKGKPVRQYEPFFTDRHDFEFEVCIGVSPVLFYDPLGRVVATLHPNHTYEKMVFDPWKQTSWDVNDTVELHPKTDPDIAPSTTHYFKEHKDWQSWLNQRKNGGLGKQEQEAAEKAKAHANTPGTAHFDTLGRPFLTFAHNGFEDPAKTIPILYATRVELDIEGNEQAVIDARGNTVMQYAYNMAGPEESEDDEEEETATNRIYQDSMDAGKRWTLNDSAGNPIHSWDSRGHHFRTEYDELRRPVKQYIRGEYKKGNQADGHESDPASIDTKGILFERIIYGENQGLDAGKAANLRGHPYRLYDSSACTTNVSFDFKGTVLKEQKQHVNNPKASLTHWSNTNLQTALQGSETFTRFSEVDALGRMTRQYNWHTSPNYVAVYEPKYNDRGLLIEETLTVQAQKTNSGFSGGEKSTAVSAISYDAKGQRQSVRNGNGTITRYQYDPLTLRLEQLRTTKPGYDPKFPDYHSNLKNRNILQQLFYTYDPVGNIIEIVDEAYEPVFFDNQEVEPRSRYRYDPLYRLIEAEGRESASTKPPNQKESKAVEVIFPVFPESDNALRNYTQHYSYDSVGNITQMKHVAGKGSWTRRYTYYDENNRLKSTLLGNGITKTITYRYDAHGNMLNLTSVNESINWDYRDMIHSCDLNGGGTVYYSYDAKKQRSRKFLKRNGTTVKERFYLDGMERYRRWRMGRDNIELLEDIETHHLFVDEQRVLMVEDVIKTNSSHLNSVVLYRYQHGNHLGSVALELDEKANIISYEEYHPYGTSAYRLRNKEVKASYKRYRYTGMERDEETGLNYHGARYYAAWLGRWCSCDPIFINIGMSIEKQIELKFSPDSEERPYRNNMPTQGTEGVNDYTYAACNPVIFIDPDGKRIYLIGTMKERQFLKKALERITFTDISTIQSSNVRHSDVIIGATGKEIAVKASALRAGIKFAKKYGNSLQSTNDKIPGFPSFFSPENLRNLGHFLSSYEVTSLQAKSKYYNKISADYKEQRELLRELLVLYSDKINIGIKLVSPAHFEGPSGLRSRLMIIQGGGLYDSKRKIVYIDKECIASPSKCGNRPAASGNPEKELSFWEVLSHELFGHALQDARGEDVADETIPRKREKLGLPRV